MRRRHPHAQLGGEGDDRIPTSLVALEGTNDEVTPHLLRLRQHDRKLLPASTDQWKLVIPGSPTFPISSHHHSLLCVI
jgi:hypothetical protein